MKIIRLSIWILLFGIVVPTTIASCKKDDSTEQIDDGDEKKDDSYTFGLLNYNYGGVTKEFTKSQKGQQIVLGYDVCAIRLIINDSTKFILTINNGMRTPLSSPTSYYIEGANDAGADFTVQMLNEDWLQTLRFYDGELLITEYSPTTGVIKGSITGTGREISWQNVMEFMDLQNGNGISDLNFDFEIQASGIIDYVDGTFTKIIIE